MINGTYVIDADSHVEETEETWSYLEPPYSSKPPLVVEKHGGKGLTIQDAFWLIDGKLYPHLTGRGATVYGTPVSSTFGQGKSCTIESQTLSDVQARIRDLDKLGIDVQVLFPTVFLEPLTEDPGYMSALIRSYNTWIQAKCAQRPERLKWAAVMPLHNVSDAIAELRRAHEMGAACAVTYGTVGEDMLHYPRFDPFWAEATRLGMPVAVHVGWSHPGLTASGDNVFSGQIVGFTLPVFMGFFSFVGGGILDRFPELKVCFLEAGADWLPYMIQRMDQYYGMDSERQWAVLAREKPSAYMKKGNVFFTSEGGEELLPAVLKKFGDEFMMASADMPHEEGRETSLEEIYERDDLTEAQKVKILGQNARSFFRL